MCVCVCVCVCASMLNQFIRYILWWLTLRSDVSKRHLSMLLKSFGENLNRTVVLLIKSTMLSTFRKMEAISMI